MRYDLQAKVIFDTEKYGHYNIFFVPHRILITPFTEYKCTIG